KRRGGLGYEKHYRALVDCRTIVTADRVRLGCYRGNRGAARRPFFGTGDLRGAPPDPRGPVDREARPAGRVGRVVTTGGGGWGDPLEREPELVARDVTEGRVSYEAARDDYGVVLRTRAASDGYDLDAAATAKLRSDLRAQRASPPPMIDRGPGYERMVRGECAPRTHT